MSEEGDGIANTKEKEVVMKTSPHSYSEWLIHSDSWIEVLLSSIWWEAGEGVGLKRMVDRVVCSLSLHYLSPGGEVEVADGGFPTI